MGQLLSPTGSAATTIAYPLLVLALTGSPAKAGLVAATARTTSVTIISRFSFWQIPLVAFVEGTGSVFFGAAQAGALRAVAPPQQLPGAAGVQETRGAVVQLGGPPSLVSPVFRRTFSMRTILYIELCTWLGSSLFLIWPNVYVLTAAILPQAIAMPVTDSAVTGYRVAITPDRLLGRSESVRSNIALLISPLGPLTAGLLLANVSPRATIAFFVVFTLGLAVWGFLSPSIRKAPSLDELDELPVRHSGLAPT